MASLNLSTNGPSIKSSYNSVVNGPPPSSASPTFAQWALFSVQAPLMNAFQDGGAKESILKVENTGDGELADLIEDFSEGRIQFAYVKVKDPNSGLPKNVLIAWCGGGVPERTKGYFTSHLNAVAKVLHGYHVQISARSDSDLEPASIMQKVADASGSKYSGGGGSGASTGPPPPIKSKPVFTPTSYGAGRRVDPLVAARSQRSGNTDADGWGEDAPPVTRTTVEKVESSYRPTKVNLSDLTKQESTPSRFSSGPRDGGSSDVVGGGYQPVGKVDIAAIRAKAKNAQDDRPTTVKGAYEPVGKVDIAAIRAKAKGSSTEGTSSAAAEPEPEREEAPRPLADRAAAFSQPAQSERMTSLPKPKVANKFGGASNFSGTKAPLPGGLGFGSPAQGSQPAVGAASKTFANEGGKTPAQIWAEKKARERGSEPSGTSNQAQPAPVTAQKSGSEWKSGYAGKSWASVQTSGNFGRPEPGTLSSENTGEASREVHEEHEAPSSQSGGVSALKDRFKGAAPMGGMAPAVPSTSGHDEEEEEEDAPAPPPVPAASRPSGGFALPGLPSRPVPADEPEEEEEDPSAYEPVERDSSPPRIALPVSRGAEQTMEPIDDRPAPPPMRPSQIDVPDEDDLPDEPAGRDMARDVASAVAEQTFEPETVAAAGASQGGKRALVLYDYEMTEDNEIDLVDGQYITNIDMVDEDWWMGTNSKGESGLFPSNYVEIAGDDDDGGDDDVQPPAAPIRAQSPEPEPTPAPSASDGGATATAIYDYEAAEDNELSFPEDAKITNLQFPDEDWWFGEFKGKQGLFPANYVQLDQ